MTPPVDDDFPEVKHSFDSAILDYADLLRPRISAAPAQAAARGYLGTTVTGDVDDADRYPPAPDAMPEEPHAIIDMRDFYHKVKEYKVIVDYIDALREHAEAAQSQLTQAEGYLKGRAESAERDLAQAQAVLEAWHEVFGTSQLTHAQARLEAAEESAKRAQAALREAQTKLSYYESLAGFMEPPTADKPE